MSPEEIQKCEEKYSKAKTVSNQSHVVRFLYSFAFPSIRLIYPSPSLPPLTSLPPSLPTQVNSILRNVASKLNYDNDQLEDLYERTAWALEEVIGVPASSYDMFKKAVV